ncbi:hypothetical protein [Microcystis phage Mae-JY02]
MTAPERIWVDEDTWFSKPVTYPNAVEYLRADVVEARLSDPVAVHANMLRGTIAKPTVEQIIHLYGREAFRPMIDAAVAKALEDACLAVSEHADWPEDEHGRTEQVGLFARVINAILAALSSTDAIAAIPARGVGVNLQLAKDCRDAVNGKGPKAYDWSDKPHRLIYDLCREIERLAALEPAPTDAPEEIGILRARVEDQTATIAALRRELAMGRAAPTDAAQAREAAQADFVTLLTDAAAVAMKAREAALRDAAEACRYDDAHDCREAILALISEART